MGTLDLNIETKKEKKQYTNFTCINTNSRSLCPKINSLIDTIDELDASMAVVTETWLMDGQTLEEDKQDLLLGAGLSLICKNRPPDSRGVSYGGVALFFKEELCSFKEVRFDNPQNFEILAAIGSIQGHSRKVAVVACYMPPNYTTARATACFNYIEEIIIELKRRLKDPYLVISGDFNQWDLQSALQEFRDLNKIDGGATRGSRLIDRTFTNFEDITEASTLTPLQTDEEDGPVRSSDHRTCFYTARLRRKERYKWLSYSYRYNNHDSEKLFAELLISKDWPKLVQLPTPDAKTNLYQSEINNAIETFFPLRTIKRRNIDPPWINPRRINITPFNRAQGEESVQGKRWQDG